MELFPHNKVDLTWLGVGGGIVEEAISKALARKNLIASINIHEYSEMDAIEAQRRFSHMFPGHSITAISGEFTTVKLPSPTLADSKRMLSILGGSLCNMPNIEKLLAGFGNLLTKGDLMLADFVIGNPEKDTRYPKDGSKKRTSFSNT